MPELKPCPCGKVPECLIIQLGECCKYAWVSGDCCNEWSIEFCTNYAKLGSDELAALAEAAWNDAVRPSPFGDDVMGGA